MTMIPSSFKEHQVQITIEDVDLLTFRDILYHRMDASGIIAHIIDELGLYYDENTHTIRSKGD
jgi:hypothetical protein